MEIRILTITQAQKGSHSCSFLHKTHPCFPCFDLSFYFTYLLQSFVLKIENKLQASSEETAKLREKIIAVRKKIHLVTKESVQARQIYEEGVSSFYSIRQSSFQFKFCCTSLFSTYLKMEILRFSVIYKLGNKSTYKSLLY